MEEELLQAVHSLTAANLDPAGRERAEKGPKPGFSTCVPDCFVGLRSTPAWYIPHHPHQPCVIVRVHFNELVVVTENSETPSGGKTWREMGIFGSFLAIFRPEHAQSSQIFGRHHPKKSKLRKFR